MAAAALVALLVLLLSFMTLQLANAKAQSLEPNTRRQYDNPAAAAAAATDYTVPPPPPWRYHVFLNFRGLDVRHSFRDHLYYALARREIKAFRDDRDLPRGEKIEEAISRAIEGSMMSIAVLSKGYASSEWCLDELVKMVAAAAGDNYVNDDKAATMAIHHQIFPVFYKVSPDEVADQSSGCYKEDFDSHKRKFSYERVDNWRHALTSIAEFSGWVINPNGDRSEAEMVEDIAEYILRKVHQLLPAGYESDSIASTGLLCEGTFGNSDQHQ